MKHDGKGQGADVHEEAAKHSLPEHEPGLENVRNEVTRPVDGTELLAAKLRKYLASGSGRPVRREAR